MKKQHHLFEALMDFATKHGAVAINKLPGCWEREWKHAGNWWLVAVHAGDGRRKTSTGAEIDPGQFWIECNGWPAGLVGLAGWSIAAGSVVNEAALREALAHA